jgi:type IV pilus assembly protein PilM
MSQEITGLDIGSYSIKVIGIRKTSNGPLLTYSEARRIPSDRRDDPDFVAQVLRTLWTEAALKTTKVHLAVSGDGVLVRRITLPSMPAKELREAVRWEMKGGLPYSIEAARVEFCVLREFVEGDVNRTDLIAAACPVDLIEKTVSMVRKAGLKPARLTVLPDALRNALLFSNRVRREGIIAVADLGARKTGIYLFENGVLQFGREATPGGADITQAILEGMGLDSDPGHGFERAEEIKKELGILTDTKTPERSKLTFLMRPVLERLTAEIRRSFDYFQNQFHADRIDLLLLAGGGANLKNVATYLTEALGLPVEPLSLLEEAVPEETQPDGRGPDLVNPLYSAAVGAALHDRKGIDFLSAEKRTRSLSGLPLERAAFVLLPVVSALVMLGLGWRLNTQIKTVGKEREMTLSQVNSLDTLQGKLLLLKGKEQQMKQELSQHPSRALESLSHGEVLRRLSHLVPANVTLKVLALEPVSPPAEGTPSPEGYRLLLEGFAMGQELQCLTGVARLIDLLEESNYFRGAKLISAEQAKWHQQPGVDFEIVSDVVSVKSDEEKIPPRPPLEKGGGR